MTIVEPGPVTLNVLNGLDALSAAVCNELATSGAGPTCWCGLYPGSAPSWEYCGECSGSACGMGYVRLAGVFPYSTFPIQAVDFHCVMPLAWTVEVGALRCVPQPADGELLSPSLMGNVALEQVLDAQALYRALKCYGLDVAAESYTPVGPMGGCVGGFWRAFLALG
jgi:hypothetical protein